MRISDWSSDVCSSDLRVTMGDSFSIAAQGGLVFKIADQWVIAADIRWIDIDASVKVNGATGGNANVDPLVYGDRTSVVSGKSVSVRLGIGGRRIIQNNRQRTTYQTST